MGLSLERMRYRVRQGLGGLSSDELTDVDCDELLNLSLWELSDKFPFKAKDAIFSNVLVDGQSEYSISDADLGTTLDALESITIIDSDGKRHALGRMTRKWLDDNYDSTDKRFPERYLREKDTLFIYPIPGASEDGLTIEIKVIESVESIVEGGNEVTGLPRNWDELVVMGAIHRGHFYFEDYDESRQSMSIQSAKIAETIPTLSKEEKDTHVGGLNVLWEWPE